MAGWREIEAELIRLLEASDINVVTISGNAYVVAFSLNECKFPGECSAVLRNGATVCPHCGGQDNDIGNDLATLDITKLAKRLADQL